MQKTPASPSSAALFLSENDLVSCVVAGSFTMYATRLVGWVRPRPSRTDLASRVSNFPLTTDEPLATNHLAARSDLEGRISQTFLKPRAYLLRQLQKKIYIYLFLWFNKKVCTV
ncbi:MAG: hypothetical protein LBO67_03475 [Spirochaetaceae bacterium]|nr:hypothetical protein [Spirochaetaceae bacterium]